MASALHRFLMIVIVALIAVMLLRYWQIGKLIFAHRIDNINHLQDFVLVAAYFGLNIAAVMGFLQQSSWRTLVTCVAIIFSTIFFSTEYIPFVTGFIEKAYRVYAMIAGNLIILLCVIALRKN